MNAHDELDLDKWIDSYGNDKQWDSIRKQNEYNIAKHLLTRGPYNYGWGVYRNQQNKYDNETIYVTRKRLTLLAHEIREHN